MYNGYDVKKKKVLALKNTHTEIVKSIFNSNLLCYFFKFREKPSVTPILLKVQCGSISKEYKTLDFKSSYKNLYSCKTF